MLEVLENEQLAQERQNFSDFNKYFPDGEISKVNIQDIPQEAMGYFEGKSSQFVSPEKYRPGDFENFFVIKHTDGSFAFLAQQTKTYDNTRETEKITYFVDISDGKVVGRSELRYCIKWREENQEYFKNKPFVGNTFTKEAARKTGLGTRRLRVMNAYARMAYGFPLYSDTLISSDAKILWDKLVEKKEAIKFKERRHDRYRFLA